MKNRFLSVLLIVTISLFIVSAGIAAPILSRSFYKAHVHSLRLPEITGWTEEEILGAYDDVMSFLLHDGEFGTGVLKWSVLNVMLDIEPVPFNRGFYSIDITFFFAVTQD